MPFPCLAIPNGSPANLPPPPLSGSHLLSHIISTSTAFWFHICPHTSSPAPLAPPLTCLHTEAPSARTSPFLTRPLFDSLSRPHASCPGASPPSCCPCPEADSRPSSSAGSAWASVKVSWSRASMPRLPSGSSRQREPWRRRSPLRGCIWGRVSVTCAGDVPHLGESVWDEYERTSCPAYGMSIDSRVSRESLCLGRLLGRASFVFYI